MIVSEVRFENREIQLCLKSFDTDKNVFTIVIGRNGSGKSKLLQKICHLAVSSIASRGNRSFRIQNLLDFPERSDVSGLDETGCLILTDGNAYQKILIETKAFTPPEIDLNLLSDIPENLRAEVRSQIRNELSVHKVYRPNWLWSL